MLQLYLQQQWCMVCELKKKSNRTSRKKKSAKSDKIHYADDMTRQTTEKEPLTLGAGVNRRNVNITPWS